MKFEINEMYKNIYKDTNMAFIINSHVSRNKNEVVVNVDWYQLADNGRYISIGINQDFAIPREMQLYYVKI